MLLDQTELGSLQGRAERLDVGGVCVPRSVITGEVGELEDPARPPVDERLRAGIDPEVARARATPRVARAGPAGGAGLHPSAGRRPRSGR